MNVCIYISNGVVFSSLDVDDTSFSYYVLMDGERRRDDKRHYLGNVMCVCVFIPYVFTLVRYAAVKWWRW